MNDVHTHPDVTHCLEIPARSVFLLLVSWWFKPDTVLHGSPTATGNGLHQIVQKWSCHTLADQCISCLEEANHGNYTMEQQVFCCDTGLADFTALAPYQTSNVHIRSLHS